MTFAKLKSTAGDGSREEEEGMRVLMALRWDMIWGHG